jgi:hypothetical protein
MDIETIEKTLTEVQGKMPEILGAPTATSGWWPAVGRECTNFATSFLLRLAQQVCSNVKLAIHANEGKDGVDAAIMDAFIKKNKNFRRLKGTIVVDLTVQNIASGDPFEFSAESEVGNHSVGDDFLKEKYDDDYAWDFFKLLTLPARNRVFFAVVHAPQKNRMYDAKS